VTRADAKRHLVDTELDDHQRAEWVEPVAYGGEALMRFYGRHWLQVNRSRLAQPQTVRAA